MSRKVAFTVPAGSKNYNVNDQHSDDDMKTFVYPTFDDMFYNRDIVKVDKVSDHEYHDVRKLPMMLWKANINFVETLFPYRVETTSKLYTDLIAIRDDIARMNLPYLYDACFGMYYRKMKEFDRDMHYQPAFKTDYEAKQWNQKINKHGATAYRSIDFLLRFHMTRFQNFKDAICYPEGSKTRDIILQMRNGYYNHNQILTMLKNKQQIIEEVCKSDYKSQKADEKTKQKVESIVKHYVETEIYKELK